MKKLIDIHHNADAHWVGNGFPVRTIFSFQTLGQYISPFLMLDYAGPAEFPPSDQPRGVGEHPHRGFETVTIVYQGELEHRDSAGNHGKTGPGDVQWMTAASGVVHEEWHEQAFTRRGGVLEMVQLWVNLPAKHKMSPPRYQEILNAQIPVVPLDGGGTARVIAGEFAANEDTQSFERARKSVQQRLDRMVIEWKKSRKRCRNRGNGNDARQSHAAGAEIAWSARDMTVLPVLRHAEGRAVNQKRAC